MRPASPYLWSAPAGEGCRYRFGETAIENCGGLHGAAIRNKIAATPDETGAQPSIRYVQHSLQSQSGSELATLTDADFEEFSHVRHVGSRGRSLVTRALLRRALSQAVKGRVQWKEWVFERTASGKPVLHKLFPQLCFSCTHTQWVSAVAVSLNVPLGIDLEPSDTSFDQSLIESCFSRRERQLVDLLPVNARSQQYTRLWTLKEAFLKSIGQGLVEDLRRIEFSQSFESYAMPRGRGTTIACSTFKSWRFFVGDRQFTAALAMNQG